MAISGSRIIPFTNNSVLLFFLTDEFKQKFIQTHISPNQNTAAGRKHIEAIREKMSLLGHLNSNDFLKLVYFEVPPCKKEKRTDVAEGEFGIRVEKYLKCLKCQQVFPRIYTTVGAISHFETCVGNSDGATSSNLNPKSQRKMARNKIRQKNRNAMKKQMRKERRKQ